MIQIENVSMQFPVPRRYRDYLVNPLGKARQYLALQHVNLDIQAGDRVAFLGVNGAGKTTLLKLVGGLLYPSSGTISVGGFSTVTHNQKARQAVGFALNEERSFYWRLSGAQNLAFFGTLDNLRGAALEGKVAELIGLVGLESAAHKPVATYSSGMKQRLAIARGLLCDPKILILDEPTRTLDPQAVEEVKRLVSRKIHESENRTLLIATHRFDEAETLCNKVCVMRAGKLLAYRPMPEIKAAFGSVSEYYHAVMSRLEAVPA